MQFDYCSLWVKWGECVLQINKTGYTVSIHLGMLLTGMCYISMGYVM